MCATIPPLPSTPSCRGTQLKHRANLKIIHDNRNNYSLYQISQFFSVAETVLNNPTKFESLCKISYHVTLLRCHPLTNPQSVGSPIVRCPRVLIQHTVVITHIWRSFRPSALHVYTTDMVTDLSATERY